jgi:hypothetical protein
MGQYKGFCGLFRVSEALAAKRLGIGFEYDLYEQCRRQVRRSKHRPLIYYVGHGCLINAELYYEIGGFPTNSPTEDRALGYHASVLGAEVTPMPTLDYCDIPIRNRYANKQSRFWYTGSSLFD